MDNYIDLKPFKFWCQKVLPLVYDDSLSYYELLCKVVDYLNKTMQNVETLHSDVTNLNKDYEKLQSYVNNYFSSLDVQEEINKKLDDMADSGELYEILSRFGFGIVNVLNLGVKNDGTNPEENARILNDATTKYDLYFPYGTYSISGTFNVVKNIIGFGSARNARMSVATIKATTSVSQSAIKVSSSAYITGIDVDLNNISGLHGIYINHEYYDKCYLSDVSIRNVGEGSTGLTIYPKGENSRSTYVTNLSVFGSGLSNSLGIKITENAPDCKLDGIEIMGCRRGIYCGHFFYGSNIHIWCGAIGEKLTSEYWKTTVGIVVDYAGFNAINIYFDTCYRDIVINQKTSRTSIVNYFHYCDSSAETLADATDGTLISNDNDAYVSVCGLEYYNNKNLGHVTNATARNTMFTNAMCFLSRDKQVTLSSNFINSLPTSQVDTRKHWTYKYSFTDLKYVPIAIFVKTYSNGANTIRISDSGNNLVDVIISSDKVVKSTTKGGKSLFYKELDNLIVLYTKVKSAFIDVDIISTNNGFPTVTMGSILDAHGSIVNFDTLNDASELYEVDEISEWSTGSIVTEYATVKDNYVYYNARECYVTARFVVTREIPAWTDFALINVGGRNIKPYSFVYNGNTNKRGKINNNNLQTTETIAVGDTLEINASFPLG